MQASIKLVSLVLTICSLSLSTASQGVLLLWPVLGDEVGNISHNVSVGERGFASVTKVFNHEYVCTYHAEMIAFVDASEVCTLNYATFDPKTGRVLTNRTMQIPHDQYTAMMQDIEKIQRQNAAFYQKHNLSPAVAEMIGTNFVQTPFLLPSYDATVTA